MGQVSAQDALGKIDEYNAAMELPFTGLVGLRALTAAPASRNETLAREELSSCVKICQMLEQAFSSKLESSDTDVFLYSAFARVFPSRPDREEFLILLSRVQEVFSRILGSRTPSEQLPPSEQLEDLIEEFLRLRDRINEQIPREPYLSSLSGNPIGNSATQGQD